MILNYSSEGALYVYHSTPDLRLRGVRLVSYSISHSLIASNFQREKNSQTNWRSVPKKESTTFSGNFLFGAPCCYVTNNNLHPSISKEESIDANVCQHLRASHGYTLLYDILWLNKSWNDSQPTRRRLPRDGIVCYHFIITHKYTCN